MFGTLDVRTAQVLVCNSDFADERKVRNLSLSIDSLVHAGCVPIINENDVVSSHDDATHAFVDNDALAALIARHLHADLLIVLTNVAGVFTDNPSVNADAKLLARVTPSGIDGLGLQGKSHCGRGGMSSKLAACFAAVSTSEAKELRANEQTATLANEAPMYAAVSGGRPVPAALIADGRDANTIRRACSGTLHRDGAVSGTLILCDEKGRIAAELESGAGAASSSCTSSVAQTSTIEAVQLRALAVAARDGQRLLAQQSHATRCQALHAVADALEERSADILQVNAAEVQRAQEQQLAAPLLKRLALTESKLASLCQGIRSLAAQPDPLAGLVSAIEVATDLKLVQRRVPLGTILIIFESRPDCLPQICALALKSGNALVLKGGKEAGIHHLSRKNATFICVLLCCVHLFLAQTCTLLHEIVTEALHKSTDGKVPKQTFALVHSRSAISKVLIER